MKCRTVAQVHSKKKKAARHDPHQWFRYCEQYLVRTSLRSVTAVGVTTDWWFSHCIEPHHSTDSQWLVVSCTISPDSLPESEPMLLTWFGTSLIIR